MNRFFIPMQLPNKTFQDKILTRGRIINSPEVKDIQDMFLGHLHQHKPSEPVPRGKADQLNAMNEVDLELVAEYNEMVGV